MIIILSCLQCEKRICNLEKQIWIVLNALYNHYFQSDLIGSAVCKSLAAQVHFIVCIIIMLFRNSFNDISFNVIKSLKQLFKVKLQISDEQFPDKSFYTAFLYINSFSAYCEWHLLFYNCYLDASAAVNVAHCLGMAQTLDGSCLCVLVEPAGIARHSGLHGAEERAMEDRPKKG